MSIRQQGRDDVSAIYVPATYVFSVGCSIFAPVLAFFLTLAGSIMTGISYSSSTETEYFPKDSTLIAGPIVLGIGLVFMILSFIICARNSCSKKVEQERLEHQPYVSNPNRNIPNRELYYSSTSLNHQLCCEFQPHYSSLPNGINREQPLSPSFSQYTEFITSPIAFPYALPLAYPDRPPPYSENVGKINN